MSALDKIYSASKMLFNSMPFYGILSLRVRKVIDDSVATACIRLASDNFSMEMAFNSEWVDQWSVEQIRGLIEHELNHMINNHLHDPMYNKEGIDAEIMNIAMDCEINQYIDRKFLPTEGVWLDDISKKLGLSLPAKAGTMTYYDLLKKKNKDSNSITMDSNGNIFINGQRVGTVDVHTKIKNPVATQAVVESIVENAAEETLKRRGTIPGSVEQLLKLVQEKRKPVIDWKAFLRRFVHNSYKEYCITTRRRESRRFDENPGLRHEPEFSLLVGIDSSGSVSDDELKEFMAEIANIYRQKCEIRILVCDTRIVQDIKYKGEKYEFKINGRGGTDFEPVLQEYAKSKSTCLVYFTDGECYLSSKPNKPVLWVLSSRGTDQYLKDQKTVKINSKTKN